MIDYQLTGKTAIVTGGVSGIGLAVAQTLAASGARISVWDLKQDAVDATVAQLQAHGGQAIGVALDVTDDAAVEAAVQRTVKELGGVHIAVNNAGISGPAASSGDYPVDGWQRVIDVNLTSVFLCQRAQIQAMRAAGSGGSIINMASILGQVGYAGSTAYVAAKHGVVGLTQTAAWEHAADGIRVSRHRWRSTCRSRTRHRRWPARPPAPPLPPPCPAASMRGGPPGWRAPSGPSSPAATC